MNEIQFKILNIDIENSIVGNTFITAMCIPDMIKISIVVPNYKNNDRKLIRKELLREYKEIKNPSHDIKPTRISIGEIL